MSDHQKEHESATALELAARYLRQLRRFWAAVLALTVACSLVLGVQARKQHVPSYEAKARLSISSSYQGDDIFSASYYDNAIAQQLAAAFPHMLSTDLMKDLMLERLGKPYINGTITPYSVVNTNMFVLTVRSSDPQDARDILVAVIECFPQVAGYFVDNPRVDVLEEIAVPTEPVNPFSWPDALMDGAVKGLALGLALVALAAVLTKNVTSPRQLKHVANLPLLATFPQLTAKRRRSKREVMVTAESDPGFAEALRGLSLKLRKELAEKENRVVVVTSTISGEGKTTTAVNLARTLAEDGSRVALVDADLRNQSIARIFGGTADRGLLDCLNDEGLDVLQHLQQMPGCNVMYLSGDSAPDWKYAIDQKQMRRVLQQLKEQFDYVVLDTSPCAMVADTALMCRFGDCVLYVVRSDWAREAQVIDNVSALHEREVDLTGFVYNGAPRRRSGYSYGYGYGYGSRYGYGYGYGSKKR